MVKVILTIVIMVLAIFFLIAVNIQAYAQMKQIDYWEDNSEWWWKSKDETIHVLFYDPDTDYIVFETYTHHLRYKIKRPVFNKWVESGEFVQRERK